MSNQQIFKTAHAPCKQIRQVGGEIHWDARLRATDKLANRLNSLDELFDGIDSGAIQSWDFAFQNEIGIEYVDFSSLPTFGGEGPMDTCGVFSWDETRLMILEDGSGYKIVARDIPIAVGSDGKCYVIGKAANE